MCFVLSLVVLLFDNYIAPTLSTYIVIGILNIHYHCFQQLNDKFISFTTSDNAMYSASVLDNTTLVIPLLFHTIDIPQKYTKYP